MLAENKMIQSSHYVHLVFLIFHVQWLNQLRFYNTLFRESLLIFKDFKSHKLFLFVVKHAQDNTKSSLTKFSDDLISIAEVFMVSDHVLFLVCVKTMVVRFINFSIFRTTWQICLSLILYPQVYREEIDICIVSFSRKFFFFLFKEIFAKQFESLFISHRKTYYFLFLFIVFCKCESCRWDIAELVFSCRT